MALPGTRLRRFYGSHPLHLLTMTAGFALTGYILFTFPIPTLWNPQAWWQSIAIWLAAAIVFHDLVLFPIYALADRVLDFVTKRLPRPPRGRRRVPVRNYVRIPALGAALTLLIFFPGIIEQGSATYVAATAQTQQPFLGRWLGLTAAMFFVSSLAYAIRLVHARLRARDAESQSVTAALTRGESFPT